MKNRTGNALFPGRCGSLFCLVLILYSCSAKTISSGYYYQHEKVLEKIEQSYKELYKQRSFKIAFADKAFRTVTTEIITDSLTYIYEFGIGEDRLKDTLSKYGLNAKGVTGLINLMLSIHCTWVNNFDYYVDDQKKSLIFISIKPIALNPLLSYKKYYILSFFPRPQQFDEKGRLLDKRKIRRLRKINGDIFYRINDKVCYAISGQFR